MPKKKKQPKKKKRRGKAQKKTIRRKQWYAQSRGAPYKGQDTDPHPLSPDEEMMMNVDAMTGMLLLGKKGRGKKPEIKDSEGGEVDDHPTETSKD